MQGCGTALRVELGWAFGEPQEEPLIGSIQPFKNFLNGLAVQPAARDAFGEVVLHPAERDVPSRQGVVAFLQGQSVVPDKTGFPQHSVELAVPL